MNRYGRGWGRGQTGPLRPLSPCIARADLSSVALLLCRVSGWLVHCYCYLASASGRLCGAGCCHGCCPLHRPCRPFICGAASLLASGWLVHCHCHLASMSGRLCGTGCCHGCCPLHRPRRPFICGAASLSGTQPVTPLPPDTPPDTALDPAWEWNGLCPHSAHASTRR